MLQLWKPASPGACSTSRGHCTTRGPCITTREKALVVAKTQHRQKEINKLKKNLSECLVSLFQRISFQCFSSNNKPRRSLMCELTGITHFILHLCFFYSLSKGNLCRVLLLELAQPPHKKHSLTIPVKRGNRSIHVITHTSSSSFSIHSSKVHSMSWAILRTHGSHLTLHSCTVNCYCFMFFFAQIVIILKAGIFSLYRIAKR